MLFDDSGRDVGRNIRSSTFIPLSMRPNVAGSSVEPPLDFSSLTIEDLMDTSLRKKFVDRILNCFQERAMDDPAAVEAFSFLGVIFPDE